MSEGYLGATTAFLGCHPSSHPLTEAQRKEGSFFNAPVAPLKVVSVHLLPRFFLVALVNLSRGIGVTFTGSESKLPMPNVTRSF